MEHFTGALKKYADFNGRATRTEFWMFFLIYIIIYIVLTLIDSSVVVGLIGLPILSLAFGLALLIPSLSIGARRLHDIGRSGWWQLIMLIPLIGFIVLIVFWVMDSKEDNQFGPNKKLVQA